ncbi:MAG: urease accessory protein UreD [Puniceicoccaceae bacterium]|nr:urease accessory protein UreD [Puniceicoccaceae bacterium]
MIEETYMQRVDRHRSAVLGGAKLSYSPTAGFGTRLNNQWVRPPLHLAKAYHEKNWAISILTSPTAGLLADDRLEISATIMPNAKAAIISPAACRVHTMAQGHAEIKQHYKVEAGAVLDIWPAPLVLQKDAALRQSTFIEAAPDATVFFCELVSPGRAAFGERFCFREWRSHTRVERDGELLALENFFCDPSSGDLEDWRTLYPNGNYACFYYLSALPLNEIVQQLHQLELTGAILGASPLRVGGIGIKIIAADGIELRKTVALVRNLLIIHSNIPVPQALRRSQTFFN